MAKAKTRPEGGEAPAGTASPPVRQVESNEDESKAAENPQPKVEETPYQVTLVSGSSYGVLGRDFFLNRPVVISGEPELIEAVRNNNSFRVQPLVRKVRKDGAK